MPGATFTLILAGMLLIDSIRALRDPRPYRFAFVAFWGLLLFAHVADQEAFLPAVGVLLVIGLILKFRRPRAARSLQRLLKESEKGRPTAERKTDRLWDREIDAP